MVIVHKYQDEEISTNGHLDAPPSYETITAGDSGQSNHRCIIDEKPPQPSSPTTPSCGSGNHQSDASASRPVNRISNPTSWLSMIPFTSSSRTSKQVRQTVFALTRDLIFAVDSPELLSNCADACRAYNLNFSAILQEPSIENHSAIYWGVFNQRDTLLPTLLGYAAPLSQSTISEIRLACLATSNQALFQSLRCQRDPFSKKMNPLSTNLGADVLVLGSMPADDVSIRELDDEGVFIADIQINFWQRRMRVSGRVGVEFIARGRIWSLTFFAPPTTTHMAVGMWQVALCLLEHSPPTFIDSRLVIDMPSPTPNISRASDLISLSPPPEDLSAATTRSPAQPSSSPPLSSESKRKSKVPQNIQVRLKSAYRLAHRASNTYLDAAFSAQRVWRPPRAEQWTDDNGIKYIDAISTSLDEGTGAELLYANSPFIASDGTLHAHLEARLGKPDSTECIIC